YARPHITVMSSPEFVLLNLGRPPARFVFSVGRSSFRKAMNGLRYGLRQCPQRGREVVLLQEKDRVGVAGERLHDVDLLGGEHAGEVAQKARGLFDALGARYRDFDQILADRDQLALP